MAHGGKKSINEKKYGSGIAKVMNQKTSSFNTGTQGKPSKKGK